MDVISPSLCPKQYDMHSPFKWWRRKKRKLSCNKLPQNNLPIIRYLMVLQGPTVGEKCFDAWNLNINMMCRQYTPSLFLIRVMFQKNNFFPRKATVNVVVVYGPWTFALRVPRVPGDCPVKQSEPETVAEKGAKEKKKRGRRKSTSFHVHALRATFVFWCVMHVFVFLCMKHATGARKNLSKMSSQTSAVEKGNALTNNKSNNQLCNCHGFWHRASKWSVPMRAPTYNNR